MNSENLQGRSGLGKQEWRKGYNSKQLELHTFCTPLNSYTFMCKFAVFPSTTLDKIIDSLQFARIEEKSNVRVTFYSVGHCSEC